MLFAPDTPQSVVDEAASSHSEFNADDRWGTTATNGGGLGYGDPTTLTWSIAPDGTNIPGFNGEAAAGSNLVSVFRGYYGLSHNPGDTDYTGEIWFEHIASALDRWSELSGINYVYEPNDDGAAFSNFASAAPGVIGTRGDVRIGGHHIDGNGGVLAYNFFPDNGEMVIDTNDSFYTNLSNNSLRFRNVVAHEAGHGLGFNHVESSSSAFLMEPFLSTAFDGPQLDDILASHRNFGDAFEFENGNETPATATSLGSILNGQTISIGLDATDTVVAATDIDFVSIDDDGDTDVFSFSVAAPSTIDVAVTPQGPSYSQGPQGGSQSTYDAGNQSDLTVEILDANGSVVLASANAAGIGGAESVNGLSVASAGTYYARITGAQNAVQLYRLDVTANFDVAPSEVSLAPDGSVDLIEGDGGLVDYSFVITRSGDTTNSATIDWSVAGVGANPADAADFGGTLPSGTVTFLPGSVSESITVQVSGDTDVETLEGFAVSLSNPSSGVSIDNNEVGATIINDDASVSIAPASASQSEGDTGTTALTFTVTRIGKVDAPATVFWTATGFGTNSASGTDFTNDVFPAGQLSFSGNVTTRTVTIDVTGDLDVEADETFAVSLSGATGGMQIGTATATGTILNDDSDISIAADSAIRPEGDTGSTAYTFTVTRTGDDRSTTDVAWSVAGAGATPADAADFGGTLPSGTVTIPAGASSATIAVNVSGDSDVESDEGFTVTLTSASGNAEIISASADGSILNDDVQIDIELVATDADKAEGDSGSTAFTYLLTRTGDSSGASAVDFSVSGSGTNAANAADFGGSLPSGTVNFAAGETQQTITVNVSGDLDVEADEQFSVTLSNAVNAEIVTGSASGTIRNDDSSVSIAAVGSSSLDEGDSGLTDFTFEISRAGDSSGSVDVSYTVTGSGANPADAADFGGSLPGGTVTFAAGETSRIITVSVTGDTDLEASEGFEVSLSTASEHTTVAGGAATATIVNDDFGDSGVVLVDGVLIITGTGESEYISVSNYRRDFGVFVYSYDTGQSTWDTFRKSDVTSVVINAAGGNDFVNLNRFSRPSTIDLGDGDDWAYGGHKNDDISGGDGNDVIYSFNGDDTVDGGAGDDYVRGGNGNDVLRSGNGENVLFGENGNDILIGGDNADYLDGGNGRDIVIGGAGSDWLAAGNGDDIVIGGSTIYDNDLSALDAIMSEWTARSRYSDRVATIQTGGGNLNGVKLEAGTTVLDDGATDYLFGHRGKDWFFGKTDGDDSDQIFSRFNEVVDALP